MDHMKLSYGPKFIYLLSFTCPECKQHLLTREYSDLQKTEAELKAAAHPVQCCKCNQFKGGLYGSEIINIVELEWAA